MSHEQDQGFCGRDPAEERASHEGNCSVFERSSPPAESAATTFPGSSENPADPRESVLELATRWQLPMFPCRPDKKPLTRHGHLDATSDVEQIERWLDRYTNARWAVATGAKSNLLFLDIDRSGLQWYSYHKDRLACHRTHKTPRGLHCLYHMPGFRVSCSAGKIADGVDIRAEGGYAVWWPSHGYKVKGKLEDIGAAPEWLLALLQHPADHVREKGRMIPEGRRNDTLASEAGKLRRRGASADGIYSQLADINARTCSPPLSLAEVRRVADSIARYPPAEPCIAEFRAYLPDHKYIFMPTGDLWPTASVDARLTWCTDTSGRPVKPSAWLDRHAAVEQMTWAPGLPTLIEHKLIDAGGWIDHAGCTTFNLYRPPVLRYGDPAKAGLWLEHVRRVYPEDAEHIIYWLAHRVQRPGEKVNHALVLGGRQGIGKDTILEPVKHAVGPWNFHEVSPAVLLGRFNGFIRSVILRISEARDLGDVDRIAFYDHSKVYTAAPPDVIRCDEKNVREYPVPNVCGVIITSNHKSDGLYLPADDRRHYVAWSELDRDCFAAAYWNALWGWYGSGGISHVAAYLASLDLSGFDAKAPPPKTEAFWHIVNAGRPPEDSELIDILEALDWPPVVTLGQLIERAKVQHVDLAQWLSDRRNRRRIPHRLESAGYEPLRNPAAKDGYFVVSGRRQAIYANASLPICDRHSAANRLCQCSR